MSRHSTASHSIPMHEERLRTGNVRPRTVPELAARLGVTVGELMRLEWPLATPRVHSDREAAALRRCRHWIAANVLTDGYLWSLRHPDAQLPPLRFGAAGVRRACRGVGLSEPVVAALTLLATDPWRGRRRLSSDPVLRGAFVGTLRLLRRERSTVPAVPGYGDWARMLRDESRRLWREFNRQV